MKESQKEVKEEQKHIDAFDIYFHARQAGASKRASIRQVAGKQNFNVTTVWKWKKKFNWDEREAVRSANVNKGVEKKSNLSIVDNKVKYLSFYHKLLDDLKNDFDIKVENVSDLRRVTDACLVLQGEVTERTEQKGKYDVSIYDRVREREEYYKQLEEKSEGID
jgi:hypothetical protein